MDFDLGAEADATRAEARQFAADHVTPAVHEAMEATGTHHDAAFAEALGDRGWVAPGWPPAEGGAGLSWLQQLVINREFAAVSAPTDALGTTMLVGSTLRTWGTPEQKAEVLAGIVAGRTQVCLGYSEADSGSDVAAARTRAVRDGQEWVINGEKMFTSLAQVCDYVFLLTRTNPDVQKHKGLTMFLVPMSTPGIRVDEIKTLGGERTNVTSYQDVRVPDSCRVGEIDGGWAVLTSALDLEHTATYAPEVARMLRVAAGEAGRTRAGGSCLLDQPVARARLARVAIDAEVSELLSLRAGWLADQRRPMPCQGSMAKLYSSEAAARASATLLAMFGAEGLGRGGGHGGAGLGVLEHAFRHTQVTRIYAGTSEIHRSIVAERGLGLPRSRGNA